MTKRKIRNLIRHYLERLKLSEWKCTYLELSTYPTLDGVPVLGWCKVTNHKRRFFHLGLKMGQEGPELAKVIVHEIAHIATQMFEQAIKDGDEKEQGRWEEFIAEMAEELVF